MPERLRGAIIGCGYFAQFQLAAWKRMEDVELVAASDLDLARARAAAPHAYTDATEMLEREQLDFVDIATRPASHLELVRLTLGRGIPTICQKPMASTWDEAVEMARLAGTAEAAPLVIHENWRWQPWYREAQRLIEAGAVGKPVSYCFRTRQRDGLGEAPYARQPYFREMPRLLVYETVVHHIDTARFLFGPIDSLYARIRRHNPVIRGEDCVMLVLRHAAVDGVIDGHRFVDPEPPGPAMGEAWIDGEEAGLRINSRGEMFRGAELIYTPPAELGYKGDSVFATQRHFIDCLRAGVPAESNAQAYLETFAAVESAYRSVAEGREVRPAEILTQPNNR